MSRSAFLISYDNGELYEDRHITPLCIVSTKKRAEAKIAVWMAWVEKARAMMPPYLEIPEGLFEVDAEDCYDKHDKAMRSFFDSLKPPHGLGRLVSMVSRNSGDGEYGTLGFTKLPVFK